LKDLQTLQGLYLSGSKITDKGLETLAQMPQLASLGIRVTQITDAGLAHLAKLPNLHTLDVHSTQITDTGLQHLKGMTNLTTIYLGPAISAEAIAKLKMALPNLKDVQRD